MEKSRITVHFHIAVVMRLQKNVIAISQKRFAKRFLDNWDLFKESLA